ncbi:hypothetical protein P692DRAFT_20734023, partial [Suillus brevipes Sb2]
NMSLDSSFRGTPSFDYEPAPWYPFQNADFDQCVPSSFSARQDEHLSAPIVQARQIDDSVKCHFPGCTKKVTKLNLNRHVEEVHKKKIVGFCGNCNRPFRRLHVLVAHERECKKS